MRLRAGTALTFLTDRLLRALLFGVTPLLVAACNEGPGAPEFRRMLLSGMSDSGFLKHIEGVPVTVDQWQLEKLALVTTRNPLFYYVPGLPAEYHAGAWGRVCATPAEAVQTFIAGLPENAQIAVIPEGPYVLAKTRAREMVAG